MGWHSIRRLRSDMLFSDYIREKAKWRCKKCSKVCRINGERVAQLEASHYFSRRHWSTRFDEKNVYALCSPCHKRMGGHTREENGEYDLWVKEMLGEKEYKMLKIRAESYSKKDEKLAMLYVKQMLKKYENKN